MVDKKTFPKLRVDGQPKLTGGARLKVRADDRRGAAPGGTQEPYVRDEETASLVVEWAVTLTLKKMADKLGISQSTLIRHYRPEIDESMSDMEIEMGSILVQMARAKYYPAVQFWLQSKGKWTRKIEVTGADGGPIDVRRLEGLSDEELAKLESAAAVLAGLDGDESEGRAEGD